MPITRQSTCRKPLFSRSSSMDKVVFWGWALLVLVGQLAIHMTVPALEAITLAWLIAGSLLVRRTALVPLVIFSCIAFMCEIQRDWAWGQLLLLITVLARVLVEHPFRRGQYVAIGTAALGCIALSCPEALSSILHEFRQFPFSDLPGQFFHPAASWAMFPLRQTVDRTIVITLCVALICAGKYVSSHQIWSAFRATGLFMLLSTILARLLPWHEPHRFLGTSNYPEFSGYLLHGAGYNPIFLTLPAAILLPWLFLPYDKRRFPVCLGASALLLPLPLVRQRALLLAMAAIALALLLALLASMRPEPRKKLVRRFSFSRSQRRLLAGALALSFMLSAAWYIVSRTPDVNPMPKNRQAHGTPAGPCKTAAPDRKQTTPGQTNRDTGSTLAPLPRPDFNQRLTANGCSIWFPDETIAQGRITFSTNPVWSALHRGTIVTLSEYPLIPAATTNGNERALDASYDPSQDDWWIHVITTTEAMRSNPLILTTNNVVDAGPAAFFVTHRGWECSIADSSGTTVYGPVGEFLPGWSGDVGAGEAARLQCGPDAAAIQHYDDVRSTTLGMENTWHGNSQDFAALRTSPAPSTAPPLVINEFNAVLPDRYLDKKGYDTTLGRIPGNGGNWVELIITGDSVDLRGWSLRWMERRYDDVPRPRAKKDTRDLTFGQVLRKKFRKVGRCRYFLWNQGINQIMRRSPWRGSGAGTWGRFHKKNNRYYEWKRDSDGKPRKKYMIYHPHMHNTFLDLAFEYGLFPALAGYALGLLMIFRILSSGGRPNRLWIFYCLSIIVMATFQHLFYTTMQLCLLIPLFLLLLDTLASMARRKRSKPTTGRSE